MQVCLLHRLLFSMTLSCRPRVVAAFHFMIGHVAACSRWGRTRLAKQVLHFVPLNCRCGFICETRRRRLAFKDDSVAAFVMEDSTQFSYQDIKEMNANVCSTNIVIGGSIKMLLLVNAPPQTSPYGSRNNFHIVHVSVTL